MFLLVNEKTQPLTAEDKPIFDTVKSTLGDQVTDDLAIRVTRAYRSKTINREEFTIAETTKILAARAALDVDNVLTHELPMSKQYNENWPAYIYGKDNEGHVVTVDRLSVINSDGLMRAFGNANELLPHRWQYIERIQWEEAAISKRLGRRVYKHISIIDL